ncbi:hypothetical protein BZ163_29695 [Pseudomonas sp. VI4.1]|nr:hypothetical protein BZ163_29695 [Pseudomonas sp. VI4.1]
MCSPSISLTVKQAAQVMNVSERSVYSARKIQREATPDVIEAVEQGRMSLNAALKTLNPDKAPTISVGEHLSLVLAENESLKREIARLNAKIKMLGY